MGEEPLHPQPLRSAGSQKQGQKLVSEDLGAFAWNWLSGSAHSTAGEARVSGSGRLHPDEYLW